MSVNRRTAFKVAAGAALFPDTIVSRAWAQEKQLHVGVYYAALGKIVQKDVIPAKFEKAHKCRVFTIEGATLSNIAALRAARTTPKFSVMMMDDVGVPQAKQEELIDKLGDPAKIPNLAKVYKRFLFEDSYRRRLQHLQRRHVRNDPKVTKGLTSYEQIFEPKFKKRILLSTFRATPRAARC